MDQVDWFHQQMKGLIEYNYELKRRIRELDGEPDCDHRFVLRTDVLYLKSPIRYQHRCSFCGFVKVDL